MITLEFLNIKKYFVKTFSTTLKFLEVVKYIQRHKQKIQHVGVFSSYPDFIRNSLSAMILVCDLCMRKF